MTKKPTKPAARPAAAKPARKPGKPRAKYTATGRPGIISEIITMMSRERGATVDEVLKHLAKRFPGREPSRATAHGNLALYATRRERTDAGIRYWLAS